MWTESHDNHQIQGYGIIFLFQAAKRLSLKCQTYVLGLVCTCKYFLIILAVYSRLCVFQQGFCHACSSLTSYHQSYVDQVVNKMMTERWLQVLESSNLFIAILRANITFNFFPSQATYPIIQAIPQSQIYLSKLIDFRISASHAIYMHCTFTSLFYLVEKNCVQK